MHDTDHGREATQHLQRLLGEHYHRSSKPVFQALWDNYNNCQFVEDKGQSRLQSMFDRKTDQVFVLKGISCSTRTSRGAVCFGMEIELVMY